MNLKEIKGKVISYCDIPDELLENHWLNEFQPGCLVECHIDDEEEDAISKWILENYPELKDETFYIDIDY